MKFDILLKCDQTLRLETDGIRDLEISRPTAFDDPEHAAIIFVKDEKFLKRVAAHLDQRLDKNPELGSIYSSMGMVVERKFFNRRDEEGISNLWNAVTSKFRYLLSVENIYYCMGQISLPFWQEKFEKLNDFVDGRQMGTADIDPSSLIAQQVFIGEGVRIGANVKIYSGCVIMSHSRIDDNTVLYPNVTIYPFVKIGKNCRIHSSSVIGADGFGYHFHKGVHLKIWHLGSVIIEDDVEIGAAAAIDAGTFSPTRVGAGSKIDNHVQFGHNTKIGRAVIACGGSGVAGSSAVGDYSVLGGRASITNDVSLGAKCQVAGLSGVSCDWPENSIIGGHPARPLKEWLRGVALIRKQVSEGK